MSSKILNELIKAVAEFYHEDQMTAGVVVAYLEGKAYYGSVCRYPLGEKEVISKVISASLDEIFLDLAKDWINKNLIERNILSIDTTLPSVLALIESLRDNQKVSSELFFGGSLYWAINNYYNGEIWFQEKEVRKGKDFLGYIYVSASNKKITVLNSLE